MAFNFEVNPVAINNITKTLENLKDSLKLQDKTVEIDSNGQEIVTADSEYDGLGKVTINTDVPTKPEEVLTETITENGLKTFNPTSGSVYSSASITVNVPEKKIEAEKTVNITENKETVITPTPDNAGMARVVVTTNIPQPTLEENKTQTISSNSVVEVTPSAGNDGMKKATITVNVPEKKIEANKTQSIVTNGETVITPTEGNDGMAKVTVNVNVTEPNVEANKNYGLYGNGKFEINPTSGYEAMKKVTVNVNVTATEYGDNIFNRTGEVKLVNKPGWFESITVNGNLNYDGIYTISNIPEKVLLRATLRSSRETNSAFAYCDIMNAPMLNTTSSTNFSNMFEGCKSLTIVPAYPMYNASNLSNMFNECISLQYVPALETQSVTDFSGMFEGCHNLIAIEGLDFSALWSAPQNIFGYTSIPTLKRFILNGVLNFQISSSDYILSSCADELDYDTIKSWLTAASKTTDRTAKTLDFATHSGNARTITDQDGELAALVSACSDPSKNWTISNLTIQ